MIIYILGQFLWHFLFATLGAYIGNHFSDSDKIKHKTNLIIGFLVGLFMTFFWLIIDKKI